MPPITAERKPFTQKRRRNESCLGGRRTRPCQAGKGATREMEALSSIDEIDADAVFAKFNGRAR